MSHSARKEVLTLVYFPGIGISDQVNQNHKLEKPYYYEAISNLVRYFQEGRVNDYYRNYFFNITPATDNRPFFLLLFEMEKYSYYYQGYQLLATYH